MPHAAALQSGAARPIIAFMTRFLLALAALLFPFAV
jgi:hypothetical protein